VHVAEILASKGSEVATVRPDQTIGQAIDSLAEHRVGALIVSPDGSSIEGILSERDVVRALSGNPSGVLDAPVSTIMTERVLTCGPTETVEQLMGTMTKHRIRHLPVEVDGALGGVVSIGDVVKWRLLELEEEARHVQGYIQSSGYS